VARNRALTDFDEAWERETLRKFASKLSPEARWSSANLKPCQRRKEFWALVRPP